MIDLANSREIFFGSEVTEHYLAKHIRSWKGLKRTKVVLH